MSNIIPFPYFGCRTVKSLWLIETGGIGSMRSALLVLSIGLTCLGTVAQEIAAVSHVQASTMLDDQSKDKSLRSILSEIETQFDVNIFTFPFRVLPLGALIKKPSSGRSTLLNSGVLNRHLLPLREESLTMITASAPVAAL